jgi:hypothetical protein
MTSRLCEFLRGHQEEIIGRWAERMRGVSSARDLSVSAIVDHLPQILARIADVVGSVHTGQTVSLGSLPKEHAVDRLARGFDLDQIVIEYALLRRTILELWKARVDATIDLGELEQLDLGFDESVRQAAIRYAESRERLLKAVDRISEAALGAGDLDVFLRSLLTAALDSTEAVDIAVILLREGDVLRVRAAVGLDEELEREYSIRIGEGFAGHVAAHDFSEASRQFSQSLDSEICSTWRRFRPAGCLWSRSASR